MIDSTMGAALLLAGLFAGFGLALPVILTHRTAGRYRRLADEERTRRKALDVEWRALTAEDARRRLDRMNKGGTP